MGVDGFATRLDQTRGRRSKVCDIVAVAVACTTGRVSRCRAASKAASGCSKQNKPGWIHGQESTAKLFLASPSMGMTSSRKKLSHPRAFNWRTR